MVDKWVKVGQTAVAEVLCMRRYLTTSSKMKLLTLLAAYNFC